MARRLLTIGSAISLLLFVVTIAAWADRGFLLGSRSAKISTGSGPARTDYWIGTGGRHLRLGRTRLSGAPVNGPTLPANGISTPGIRAWESSLGPRSFWRWNGFEWQSYPLVGTGTGRQLSMVGRLSYLTIPYWAGLILFAILPVWYYLRHRKWRERRRLQRGHCPNCDYDLRASHDRCPECGTPITAAMAAVAEDLGKAQAD